MNEIRMTVYAQSDVGRARKNNEDAYTVTDLATGAPIDGGEEAAALDVSDRGILMAVSDGMGGAAFGEVASALVVDSLRQSMGEQVQDAESIERLIEAAVVRANTDVWQAARASEKQGMGATLTAVLVYQQQAYVATVGDSRAYLLRRGRLRQMTRDQTYVQLLINHGLLDPKNVKNAPMKNVVLQALGVAENVEVSLGQLQLRRGDRLLLCSDGVHNALDDNEIRSVLDSCDPKAACSRMIELANERGGKDNLTAVVALLTGADLPVAVAEESVTQTFEVLKDFFPDGLPPAMKSDPPPAPPKTSEKKVILPVETKTRKTVKARKPKTKFQWPLLVGVALGLVILAEIVFILRR